MAADALTGSRHNPNRELFGQGVGNVIAGLIGGLPGAGASASTVTNIRAGGSTRVSGALRAALVLALVLGLGHLVAPIPHAVLAAILIKVGWDLIDRDLLSRARHLRRDYLIVILTPLTLTVFVDLITSGAVGLIAAGMVHARQFERFELQSVISVPLLDRNLFAGHADAAHADPGSARVGLVRLKGGFTARIPERLTSVCDYRNFLNSRLLRICDCT